MSEIQVNTINEYTGANGVTIDGLLIKDGAANGLITGADQWRLTADSTAPQTTVTGWSRASGDLMGAYIGTGMTESSGIFTFPSTGIWFVLLGGHCTTTSIMDMRIDLSNDNFTSTDTGATGRVVSNSGTDESKIYLSVLIDVQDTSNDKVKIQTVTAGTSVLKGSSATNETEITFVRLGDT